MVLIDNGGDIKKCVNSINNYNEEINEIIVFSTNEQDKSVEKWVEVPDIEWKTIFEKGSQVVSNQRMTFIQTKDFLMEGDGLQKTLSRMNELKADVAVTNIVELKEGIFYFHSLQQGNFSTITTNNIIPYMRRFFEMRMIYGMILEKNILINILQKENVDSQQRLIYFLAQYSKNMVLIAEHFYCWVNDGVRTISGFKWEKDFEYSFANRVTKKLMKEGYKDKISETIHIALCVDDNLIQYVDTLLYSIDVNQKDNVRVYLVYRNLTKKSIEKIQIIQKHLHLVDIILRKVPKYLFQMQQPISLEKTSLPIDTYLKVLLPEVLTEIDRVIYLDTDTLANENLKGLWNQQLNGCFLAASIDIKLEGNKIAQTHHALFGEEESNYFNSGVMIMDLALMRKYNTAFYITNLAIDTAHLFVQADQDAFNLFLFDAVKIIDIKYNYVVMYQSFQPRDVSDLIVLHYARPDKAWKNIGIQNSPVERHESIYLYRQYRYQIKKLMGECREKITVVIDARNDVYHEYIKCIDSFLSQDYTNIEIFIRTDESNRDEILEIVNRINKYLPNMAFVSEDSLMMILERSTGNFVYLIQMDNFLYNEAALSKMMARFDSQKNIMVTPCNRLENSTKLLYFYSENDEVSLLNINDEQRNHYFQSLNGILVRKDYLKKLLSNDSDQSLLDRFKIIDEPIQLFGLRLWLEVFN